MINQLDQEMQAVASRQEYERAAQIRNRIAELRRYASETAGTSFTDEGKKSGDKSFAIKVFYVVRYTYGFFNKNERRGFAETDPGI